ncbi:MAG: DNA-directed RNA polymerase subunit omega [Cellulosilyticaceae bacterium]
MLQPSYTQLMRKLNNDAEETVVTSRYSIVIATARRARQIIDIVNEESVSKQQEKALDMPIDPIRIKEASELNEKLKSKKPTSIAVDELYSGKIKIKERHLEG